MATEESKRLLITCITALVVVGMYVWMTRPDDSRAYSVLVNYYTTSNVNSFAFATDHAAASSEAVDLSEMSLPFPEVSAPAERLVEMQWVRDLQEFLQNEASSDIPVAAVAANYLYRDVLVNWLIASELRVEVGDPIKNILIISLDSSLHELVLARGFHSIYVSINDTVVDEEIREYQKLLITRVTVLRMINYLGFDVVHYDIDAIILRNPLSLFEQSWDSDVVGSTGTYPRDLGGLWGFTICMGVILFRSTPQTELFWEVYSIGTSTDDQKRINYALVDLDVTWDGAGAESEARHGKGLEGFKITAMSQRQVCRMQGCHTEDIPEYYIWHKGGHKTKDSKVETTSEVDAWYISDDWEDYEWSTTQGKEWLELIANFDDNR